MKSEMYEKRVAVLALHKMGKSANQIYSLLKKLPITKRFVFRTIAKYKETGSVEDRPRKGRPRSSHTEKVIKAVRSSINRNALRKQKVMAREMHIPPRTLSRIIKEDLGMSEYRRKRKKNVSKATPKLKVDNKTVTSENKTKKEGKGKFRLNKKKVSKASNTFFFTFLEAKPFGRPCPLPLIDWDKVFDTSNN
ncbi:hypothetical protein ILUMI_19807 [Ignelater luminosus]|uniref:Uncharacterized protein n=1 Tax=Ignelater luminosus TaxID=2038154 RepID=A0A8K0G585_IGNLU|nr:hypothetical protein ILUMI_19807 [Ignelater luminosus]